MAETSDQQRNNEQTGSQKKNGDNFEEKLVSNFLNENPDAKKIQDSEKFAEKFKAWIRKIGGDDLLQSLNKKNIISSFSDIANIKITVNDLLTSDSFEEIDNSFGPKVSEKGAIEKTLTHIKEKISGPSAGLDFNDFCSTFLVDNTGENPKVDQNCKIKSLKDLKMARSSYLSHKLRTSSELLSLTNGANTYDYSEKATCQTYVAKLHDKVQKITGQHASAIQQQFQSILGHAVGREVNIFEGGGDFISLRKLLKQFFDQTSGLLSDEEKKSLLNIPISLKETARLGADLGLLDQQSQSLDSITVKGMNQKLNDLSDKFLDARLRTHSQDLIKEQDDIIEQVASTITPPSTLLGGLWKKFPHTTIVNNKEPVEKQWGDYFAHLKKQLTTLHGSNSNEASNIVNVIEKLYRNNRDLSAISRGEQNTLIQANVLLQIDAIEKHGIALDVHVSKDQYYTFLRQLYDLEKKEIRLPTRGGPVVIPFTKKELTNPYNIGDTILNTFDKPYPSKQEIPIGRIIEEHNFPIQFEIDMNNMDSETLTILKALIGHDYLPSEEITNYEGNKEKVILSDRTKVEVTDKYGNTYEGYFSASGFTDRSVDESSKNPLDSGEQLFLYDKPVDDFSAKERNVVIAKDEKQEDIRNSNGLLKPIALSKDTRNDYKIKVLDKKVAVGGDALKNISTGYLVTQQDVNTNGDSESLDTLVENIEKYRDDSGEDLIDTDKKNMKDENDDGSEKNKEFASRRSSCGFLGSSKTIEENKQKGPQKGMRIWFCQERKVDQPPSKGVRSYFEINNVTYNASGTIESIDFTIRGATDSAGTVDGKRYNFDAKKFESMIKGFGNTRALSSNKKLLVTTDLGKEFADVKKHVADGVTSAGIKNKFDEIENLDLKDNKLVRQDQHEITHFVSADDVSYRTYKEDTQGNKYTIRYAVKMVKGGFQVDAENRIINPKAKDPKDTSFQEPVQITRSQTMDTAAFLLFIGERGLRPKTKDEIEVIKNADKAKGEIDAGKGLNPPKMYTRALGFNDLITLGKNFFSKGKDKIDAYSKLGVEEAEWKLYGEFKLFEKLGNLMPDWMTNRDMNIFHEMHRDYDTDVAKKRSRKKIESWIQYYEKLHHTQARPEIAEELNTTLRYLEGGDDNVPYRQRIIMAASAVYMLDKGKGPYAFPPNNNNNFPQGTWVKVILGKGMYPLYQKVLEGEKAKIEKSSMKFRDDMDILATLEFRFIAECVGQGKHGELMKEYFPGIGIGDNPNAGFGKNNNRGDYTKIYGREFASQIRQKMGPYQKGDNLKEDDINDFENSKDFDWVAGEIPKRLQQNRKAEAIAGLIALAKLARTPEQCRIVSKFACFAFTSGVFNRNIPFSYRSRLRRELRSTKFGLGNMVLVSDVNEKTAGMLDFITQGNFYGGGDKGCEFSITNHTDDNYNLGNKIGKYRNTFDKRRGKHQSDIEDFIFIQNPQSSNSVVSLARPLNPPSDPGPKLYKGKPITAAQEVICNKFYEESYDKTREINPMGLAFFEGDPWMTPWKEVERVNKSGINEQGEYDLDQKNQANDDAFAAMNFWGAMNREMGKVKSDNCIAQKDRHRIYFYLKHFFNIFEGLGDLGDGKFYQFYQCIGQAQALKKDTSNKLSPEQKDKEIRRLIRFIPYNGAFIRKQDLPEGIKEVLEGFCEFIENNLDNITTEDIKTYHQSGYAEGMDTGIYVPHAIWKDDTQRDQYLKERDIDSRETINSLIEAANNNTRRGSGGALASGVSVDTRIGFTSAKNKNLKKNQKLQPNIKLSNAGDVDFGNPSPLKVIKGGKESRTKKEVAQMIEKAGYGDQTDRLQRLSYTKSQIKELYDELGIDTNPNYAMAA